MYGTFNSSRRYIFNISLLNCKSFCYRTSIIGVQSTDNHRCRTCIYVILIIYPIIFIKRKQPPLHRKANILFDFCPCISFSFNPIKYYVSLTLIYCLFQYFKRTFNFSCIIPLSTNCHLYYACIYIIAICYCIICAFPHCCPIHPTHCRFRGMCKPIINWCISLYLPYHLLCQLAWMNRISFCYGTPLQPSSRKRRYSNRVG